LRLVSAWALGLGLVFIALRTAVASDHTILVFGDSLSAAYGIRPEQGWVALLTQRLHSQGYGYQIVNASVSGETTSGGVERLPRSLQLHRPETVILELGANDGLRGLPLGETRENLSRMVGLAQAAGARVLLVGIRIPPTTGRATRRASRVYSPSWQTNIICRSCRSCWRRWLSIRPACRPTACIQTLRASRRSWTRSGRT